MQDSVISATTPERKSDSMPDSASNPISAPTRHEVVILGAGMSGLCMAVQLKRAGQHDFVILEKSEGLGGT